MTIYYDVIINDNTKTISSEEAKCGSGTSYYGHQDGVYTDVSRLNLEQKRNTM